MAARIAISSLERGPVAMIGSVKTSRPPGLSTRHHSRKTAGRSGRWLMASMHRTASKAASENGSGWLASCWMNCCRFRPTPFAPQLWWPPRCLRPECRCPRRGIPRAVPCAGWVHRSRWRHRGALPAEVEISPRAKSVVLLRGVPTVLPNVLAATLAPDGAVDLVGETTVLLTVELRQRWLKWSLHFTWPVVHCTLSRTRALIEQKGGSYRKLRERGAIRCPLCLLVSTTRW